MFSEYYGNIIKLVTDLDILPKGSKAQIAFLKFFCLHFIAMFFGKGFFGNVLTK